MVQYYLVVWRAHCVLCTWLIIWLRFGTFSLVVRVIKLGVAGSFLEFVTTPLSSVTFKVIFLFSFRLIADGVSRALADDVVDTMSWLLWDFWSVWIGTMTLTFPSASTVVIVPTCEIGLIKWDLLVLSSDFTLSRLLSRLMPLISSGESIEDA